MSSSRSSTPIEFRPRNLNVNEKMLVMNDEVLRTRESSRRPAISRSLRLNETGMQKEEESEVHLQEAITEQTVIPIPGCKIVADYEAMAKRVKPFFQPRQYIQYSETSPNVSYDLDDEDELFLEELNAHERVLSEDKFEFMVDRFEKETEIMDGVPSLEHMRSLFLVMPLDLLKAVYNHWLKRRKESGRPLIPFVMCPDVNNKSPYLAFRPRPAKKKKTKVVDIGVYQELWLLRKELEKSRTLFDIIKKREKLKLEQVLTMQQQLDLETDRLSVEAAAQLEKNFESPVEKTADVEMQDVTQFPSSPEECSIEGEELTESKQVTQDEPVTAAAPRSKKRRHRPKQDTERSKDKKHQEQLYTVVSRESPVSKPAHHSSKRLRGA